MQSDPYGALYINIRDSLYKLSPDMRLLGEYRLEDYGVYDLVGDFGVFSNGDLLLRRGHFDPSLLDNVMAFLRISDLKSPAQPVDEGLYRCDMLTKHCQVFGDRLRDFDSAFRVAIDWSNDNVYLADTPYHNIYKFDAQGRELARKEQGYKFPNQIRLIDGDLYVVDTNHHLVQQIRSETEHFAGILRSFPVTGRKIPGGRFPYSFARVGDRWWVNNMDTHMAYGRVSIFDGDWGYLSSPELPEESGPRDIASLGDRVLVTDMVGIAIHVFDYNGDVIDVQWPGEIEKKLMQLRAESAYYTLLENVAMGLFVVFLAAGFGLAFYQARRAEDNSLTESEHQPEIDIDALNVQWLKKNTRQIRMIRFVSIAVLVLMVVSFAGLFSIDSKLVLDPIFISMPVMMLGAVYFINRMYAVELGYAGDLVLVKNGSRKYAAGKGDQIYYSNNMILIGKVFIPFMGNQSIFDMQAIVKDIMPRLKDAHFVEQGQMTNMIVRRMSPVTLSLIAIGVLAFIYLVFTVES